MEQNVNNIQLLPDDMEMATDAEKQQQVVMRPSTTYWRDAWRRLKRNRVAIVALYVLIAITLCSIIIPMVSPFTYDQQLRDETRQPPSMRHPLGTDQHGRDVLVRLMMGTRISMLVGLVSALLVLIIGATYGGIAAYFGGTVDMIMMRIVDTLMAVPSMLMIIIISIALHEPIKALLGQGGWFASILRAGSGLISIFAIFALMYWAGMARQVRGALMSVGEQEYVLAAKSMGASPMRIIFKHMIPNGIGTIMIATTFQVPGAIFTESFLSFIGLGVSVPMASLGSMASAALNGMQSYPYLLVFPAVMLSLIILSFNLLGDGLRDALDPRLRM